MAEVYGDEDVGAEVMSAKVWFVDSSMPGCVVRVEACDGKSEFDPMQYVGISKLFERDTRHSFRSKLRMAWRILRQGQDGRVVDFIHQEPMDAFIRALQQARDYAGEMPTDNGAALMAESVEREGGPR